MPRNAQFSSPEHQPFAASSDLQLREDHVNGPLPFCNPTRALFDANTTTDEVAKDVAGKVHVEANKTASPRAYHAWRSRDNRKGKSDESNLLMFSILMTSGRHVLIAPADEAPKALESLRKVLQGIARMCTVFAWWDVSWWIAMIFSVGSAIFVICGCFYWVPFAYPKKTFPRESTVGGGVTAFIGAMLFLIGGVLLIVEATNEDQTGSSGWALEQVIEPHKTTAGGSTDADNQNLTEPTSKSRMNPNQPAMLHYKPQAQHCRHHHNLGIHSANLQHPKSGRKWEWIPTWHELFTHYFREIGFLGSFILSIGAIVFWFSGLLALPGIYAHLSQPVLYGTYWLAYVVGGVLFVVSSALYVVETQRNWYTPAVYQIGWWIGVWNLIGSVGWTLSAALGYCSKGWCTYQSDLTLIWASLAFLIGSLLLWYEALDKYPVEKERKRS